MSPRRQSVRLNPNRDADGRLICVWCGDPLEGQQRRWCSDDCVNEYQIARGDQNAARRWLWMREGGVCQLCGTDTVTISYVRAVPASERSSYVRTGEWEADHIVPIAEGGPLVRENLRTLCKPCHRAETKKLRARMAARRREVSA